MSGLYARLGAVEVLRRIEKNDCVLDEALQEIFNDSRWTNLPSRDRAFLRLLVMTVLRRHGELEAIVKSYLTKDLPHKSGNVHYILLTGAAQLLFLNTAPHAAISCAVELCKADRTSFPYASLVNAVLRRVSERGHSSYTTDQSVELNIPAFLRDRWSKVYGPERAHLIAEASLREPSLDLTVKQNPERWASLLGGCVLPTGTVRIQGAGLISELEGYQDGAWWIQDAAAALPAKLLRVSKGMRVADLCAAPGGKTAQLCSLGAQVTAVDISSVRLQKIKDNLDRLKLSATLVCANATTWSPQHLFDAVLVDPPCSATGTLRRHPDILLKSHEDRLLKNRQCQSLLLTQAAKYLRKGGTLLYSTCSLECEEGELQIENFLKNNPMFRRDAILASELGGLSEALSPLGDMRTLPYYSFRGSDTFQGMDGFFASRLVHI